MIPRYNRPRYKSDPLWRRFGQKALPHGPRYLKFIKLLTNSVGMAPFIRLKYLNDFKEAVLIKQLGTILVVQTLE